VSMQTDWRQAMPFHGKVAKKLTADMTYVLMNDSKLVFYSNRLVRY
jgi:hypothetical protein